MFKYEMDPVSIVEDTERTLFCPQTDGWTDGQGETSIPPSTLLGRGYNNVITMIAISIHNADKIHTALYPYHECSFYLFVYLWQFNSFWRTMAQSWKGSPKSHLRSHISEQQFIWSWELKCRSHSSFQNRFMDISALGIYTFKGFLKLLCCQHSYCLTTTLLGTPFTHMV